MTHASSPSAANPLPPTPREVDRDSRTAAAGTGLRRQPSFTRAEKVAEAQRLRAQGMTYRAIGERLGVAAQTASDYVNDPDLARLRARKESYRGVCVDCGAPTNGGDGRGPNAAKRCFSCARQMTGEMSRQRALAQRAVIERLWAEGKTSRQIAAEVGWNPGSAARLIGACRYRGYDLPVRNVGVSAYMKAHPEHSRHALASRRAAA